MEYSVSTAETFSKKCTYIGDCCQWSWNKVKAKGVQFLDSFSMDNSNNSNINDSTNDNDNTNVNENGFVEIQQNHKIPNKTNNFLHGPRRNDGER